MPLPCSFNTFDEKYLLYEGPMTFTRKFLYEKKSEGERMILKIGAVNYLCHVFINKKYVGLHRGGSTPFCFDITDFLKEENRIHMTELEVLSDEIYYYDRIQKIFGRY